MRSSVLLYCPKCVQVTHHASQGRYDFMGHLTGVTDKCLRCGNEATTGNGHEAPADDPPPVTMVLTEMEIKRAKFAQHLIERGYLSEPKEEPWVWG